MAQVVEGTCTTFGMQTLSNRTSQPRATFGSSGRTDKIADKSMEFLKLGTTSSGHTTEVRSGFGNQISSTAVTAASHGFGTKYASDTDMKEGRPGPGTYESPLGLGSKQVSSGKPNVPEYKTGTGPRFGQFQPVFKQDFQTPFLKGDPRPTSGWLGDKPSHSFYGQAKRSDIAKGLVGRKPTAAETPGPGMYDPNPTSLFNQADSRKPTAERTRIGTARRDSHFFRYVSKEHEVDLYGKHSPAPNAYRPNTNHLSKNKSRPSFGFGSGDRFSQVKSNNAKTLKVLSPGPGEYTT